MSYRHAAEVLKMSVGSLFKYISVMELERIIERNPFNKYTVITLLNWNDLENLERIFEHKLNTKRTQNEPDNTYKTLNIDGDIPHEQSKETKPEYHLSYLLNLPSKELLELSNKYAASQEQVKSKAEELFHYCESKGKPYKNYKSLLAGALLRDFGKRDTGYSQAGYKIVRKKL